MNGSTRSGGMPYFDNGSIVSKGVSEAGCLGIVLQSANAYLTWYAFDACEAAIRTASYRTPCVYLGVSTCTAAPGRPNGAGNGAKGSLA
jgi:hypothetical protein